MRRGRVALIVALGLLAVGCRGRAVWPTHTPQSTDLVLTDRHIPPPDVSALPPLPAVAPPTPNVGYYKLTADECRTLACRNSGVANLIESAVIVHPGPFSNCTGTARVDWLRVTTAGYLSQEARTRTAAAALTLYYKLLELELKADVLTSTLAELDALVKTNDTLAAAGYKESADVYELKRQRVDLQGEQAKLRSGILKVNAELKTLLAIDPGCPGFLLPADQVTVVPDLLDPEQAVHLGLTLRADLNLLRNLASRLDEHTLIAVRQALVSIVPPLGAVVNAPDKLSAALAPFANVIAKAEATAVRRQLLGLVKDREREAAKDIRMAVDDWTTARDLVSVARKKFELGQERVTDLEKKQKAGMAAELDLRKARLDLLKAEADLVGEIARWKTADVKAREAIGLLCDCE